MLIELLAGSLSYHPGFDSELSKRFENKISDDGRLIANDLVGARLTNFKNKTYQSASAFIGENSVGAPIFGGLYSYGWAPCYYSRLGIAVGGYHQNKHEFKERQLDAPHPVMPVAGFELIFRYPLSDGWSASLNNLISPLITNHSISFGHAF